jgi:integrase
MARKLTVALIEGTQVPAGKSQVLLWDAAVTGLHLRCLAGGSKTWIYRYRAGDGGRSAPLRSVRLGSWPTLTIDAARKAARGHAGQVARGGDPADDRREARRREAATLGKLLAVDGPYERDLKARHIINVRSTLSVLRRGLSRFMATDVAELTRADLVNAIAALADAGKPGAAGDLRKHSRTLCEWCVSRGLAPSNVMAGLRAQPRSRRERLAALARGRALTDGELVAVWRAAGDLGTFGALTRLALLTAMRRGELAGLRWFDIHADRITLEAGVTKTGSAHDVPLTNLMRSVIAAQHKTTSPLIFPGPISGRRLQSWTKLVERLQRLSGVGSFTMHDLRRTCRTLMSRVGVQEDIAELAIGHARADLVARYNFDVAWDARVDAFNKVSDHIAALINAEPGANVIPFQVSL